MRADRLVRIILLLQRYPRLTASDLAQRLEVSKRTILRDVEALSMAGVPIYAERGVSGGFRLVDGYRLDLSGLRVPELRTLLLGERAALIHDLGWAQDAAAAQDKLRHALPPDTAAQAETVRQRILIDDGPWFAGTRPRPAIARLLFAVWQNRQVAITYIRPDGTTVNRRIAPYALVAKTGVWYVVAEREGALRVYRPDRMADITVLDEPFERGATFDLRRFWADWTHTFEASRPRLIARLTVSPTIYREFRQASPWPVQKVEEPDGHSPDYRMTMVFEHWETAARHIVSFTPDVRALEPLELISAVRQAIRRITAWSHDVP